MISIYRWFLFLVALFLFSCNEQLNQKVAFGGKKYGGTFTFFTSEKTDVFFPFYSPSVYNQRVLSQIFEPLVNLDEKGNVVPNLAKNLITSPDGKTITIQLRNDVYFHENDLFSGDLKMTAEDVKFSLSFACSGNQWTEKRLLFLPSRKEGRS